MFWKCKFIVFFLIFFVIISCKDAYAIYDPLSRPNNFFGIHILFPTELAKARELVNSAGGDWGYVTIPIQVGDKDLDKWQTFMVSAYSSHLIPILRLATESDYKESGVWRKPTESDGLDFDNFLSSIYWPTKNRYILFFNETNRFDEWGGDAPNPEEYASLIDYAVDVFKSKNNDFFIIMGGLDNAAPNEKGKYMNVFDYLRQMGQARPTVYNRIDGFASHSYPNPNFSQNTNPNRPMGIASYRFEYDIISSFTSLKKPIFITETGWNSKALSDDTIGTYYTRAFEDVWKKDSDKIVAITPFLLESQNGQFDKFSFIKSAGLTPYAKVFEGISKIKGEPDLNSPPPPPKNVIQAVLGIRNFRPTALFPPPYLKPSGIIKFYFKSILGL